MYITSADHTAGFEPQIIVCQFSKQTHNNQGKVLFHGENGCSVMNGIIIFNISGNPECVRIAGSPSGMSGE
jgi:hypothetical protein